MSLNENQPEQQVNPSPASSLPQQEKRWTERGCGVYPIEDGDFGDLIAVAESPLEAAKFAHAHNASFSEPKPEEPHEGAYAVMERSFIEEQEQHAETQRQLEEAKSAARFWKGRAHTLVEPAAHKVAPSVVEGVEEKSESDIQKIDCWERVWDWFVSHGFDRLHSRPSAFQTVLDYLNASLGEPREKEDLEEKEPSSALTHVLQNALKEGLARRGLDVDACVAKIKATVLRHLREHPLRCPFPSCGSRACDDSESSTVMVEERGGGFVAECEVCCSGTGTFATHDEAIDEWNQVAGAVLRGTSDGASNAVLPPPVSESPAGLTKLNSRQQELIKEWAADSPHGELFGNDEARAINLATFARSILNASAVSESPVGSTATGVEDEEIAEETSEKIRREVEHVTVVQRGFHRLPEIVTALVLTAIRKSKSLSEPKELEEEEQ